VGTLKTSQKDADHRINPKGSRRKTTELHGPAGYVSGVLFDDNEEKVGRK